MRFSSVALLVGVSAWALACGREPLDLGPTGSGDSSTAGAGAPGAAGSKGSAGSPGRVPPKHRTVASPCQPVVPPPSITCPLPPGPGMCMTDADCTQGGDGRCEVHIPYGGCTCTYDECFSDVDCPNGEVCACSGGYSGNRCVTSGCHVDADCGVGGYCTPIVDACSMAITSYACHQPGDICVADADCGDERCEFGPTSWQWTCVSAPGCPQ